MQSVRCESQAEVINSKNSVPNNCSKWSLKICMSTFSLVVINQAGISLTRWLAGCWLRGIDYRPFTLLSWTTVVHLRSWQMSGNHAKHMLLCASSKSRRLQSYWLALCSGHSNNQADSHQKALEWASFTTENIWTTLRPLCAVRCFWFARQRQS